MRRITATCWDSWFFWQLYLARTAGFKRRLDATVDVSVVDIVSTFIQLLNGQIVTRYAENVSLSQTRYYDTSNSATHRVYETRGIAIRNESENVNFALRARFSHHSIAFKRNVPDSKMGLADKRPRLEGFLSVRDFKLPLRFETGTVVVLVVLRFGNQWNQNRTKQE